MDETSETPGGVPPEPCLVCARDVLSAGGAITQHRNRPGGPVRIGWTCGAEHAAQVEACRDARGRLRPRKTWKPRARRAAAG